MPTISASALLGIRASSCRALRMRRSTASMTAGRTSFERSSGVTSLLDDRSTIHLRYRIFIAVFALTANVLHTCCMRVGVPTETKNHEYRVAITPAGVAELARRGHDVVIQAGAGEGSSISDSDFKAAGAEIISGAEPIWEQADLLLKVKEPIEPEYRLSGRGQRLLP